MAPASTVSGLGGAQSHIGRERAGAQHREGDRPHHPLRGGLAGRRDRGLGLLETLGRGLLDLGHQRTGIGVDLRKVVALLLESATADHRGHEARPVAVEQLLQLVPDGRADRRSVQRLHELLAALGDVGAVFLVAAQQKILFVAPHHQHQDGEAGLVEFREPRLDLVHSLAQIAFEAAVLVEADGALRRRHVAVARRIVVEHGAEDAGALDRIVRRQRRQDGLYRRQGGAHPFDHHVVGRDQLLVAAEQEFGVGLIGAQEALGDVVDQHLQARRRVGIALQRLLGAQSGKINAADQQNTARTEQCDLPAQA